MANRIGRSRLIHVMFDCNRVYLNNLVPEQEKVYPKKSLFLYTYTTFAGRETKALNSTQSYVEHLRSQIKTDGLMLPGAVGLLHGTGSINVVHNMLYAFYVPLGFINLPTVPAVYQKLADKEELKGNNKTFEAPEDDTDRVSTKVSD